MAVSAVEHEGGEAAETLRMLGDSARGLLVVDGAAVRALRGSEAGFDRGLWREMAANGWFSIGVPEASGGLGLGVRAACVVAERLGFASRPEPFVAAGSMAPALLAAAGGAVPDGTLERVLGGEAIVAVAWQNEAGSLEPAAVGVTARAERGGYSLDGAARLVPVATADAFLILAREAAGPAFFWLPRETAGLTVTREPTAEGGALGWLRLAGVHLPASARLMAPERAVPALEAAFDDALVVTSAELVGHMQRQLELTIEYLKTRKQFGQAIGSFQALQHRLVDLWMEKEMARHATRAAAARLDTAGLARAERRAAASGAKARASAAALLVGKQAIQLHGAIGFTDEYDLGLSFNRAVTLASFLGNAAWHRRRFEASGAAKRG
jgi:alkylation response protein AidB-like acyl-CoA dehydrogenase